MNICFYCDTIFSFGGVQRVLAVIAKALSAHHDVTILTLDAPAQEDLTMYGLQDSNIHFQYIRLPLLDSSSSEYLPCKTYSLLYKKAQLQSRRASQWYGYSSFPSSQRNVLIERLNEGNYDVVVGVHAFLSLRLASVRRQLRTRRVVGWMHTSYDAFFNTPGFYLWNLKAHFRHEIPKLDAVVVLSQTDKQRYREEMKIDTTAIYNPLTLPAQGKGKAEYKRFLAIGRMSHQTKGFDILIEAFARLAQKEKEWTLNIVGEGPEESKLKALVATHELQSRVTIHPFSKEIEQYYATSSVYVLSSRWEGFSLVLVEAMAHGLPIVASSLPIVKELLGGKGNALTFTNKDIDSLACRMEQITATPPDELARMSEASLRLSESFELAPILKQWEELLKPTV